MTADRDDRDDIDYARLARYLALESSREERAEVERWLDEDPSHRALLSSLAGGWRAAERTATTRAAVNVDSAWKRMEARIDARAGAGATVTPIRRAPTRSLVHSPLVRIAAAVLLIGGGSMYWRAIHQGPDGPAINAPGGAPRTFTTAAGERRTVVLDDGSEVLLGVASRLEVAEGYGGAARELELHGEAHFRVHDAGSGPFRVRAAGAMIEDLGTAFTVRAYDGADTVRVVVVEGAVAIRRDETSETPAVLRAGDVGVVTRSGGAERLPGVAAAPLTAWTRGQLVFDDAPMARVAADLGRWYDADVRVNGSRLEARRISVTFDARDSLDAVMQAVALTVGARYERDGKRIVFSDSLPP